MQCISLQNCFKHSSCLLKEVIAVQRWGISNIWGTVQCPVSVTKTHQKVLAVFLISGAKKSCIRLAVKLERKHRPLCAPVSTLSIHKSIVLRGHGLPEGPERQRHRTGKDLRRMPGVIFILCKSMSRLFLQYLCYLRLCIIPRQHKLSLLLLLRCFT